MHGDVAGKEVGPGIKGPRINSATQQAIVNAEKKKVVEVVEKEVLKKEVEVVKENFKTIKGNQRANEYARSQGYEDAHALKREYVGSGNEAKFDIQVDSKTGNGRLISKDQKVTVPILK